MIIYHFIKTNYKFKAKILFSSENYTWVSFFVAEYWKSSFLHMNFVIYKKNPRTKFMCKNARNKK